MHNLQTMEIEKEQLCAKIRALYPDAGSHGIDIDACYDAEQQAWMVHLEKQDREYKLYLEAADVESCLNEKRCVALGIEIAQLGSMEAHQSAGTGS